MNTFLKRFFDLAIDDFTRLKRFRRVAMNHDVALPETGMLEKMEIERLREQLNASVFLEAEPWMLPSWLDLTMKNLNKDELHITHLPNNSYRNWSLIGGVGSRKYGITDSRGLVTALPGSGSIDIWVQGTDGIIFPALMGKDGPQLKLVSPEDQLYEWKTDVQSVEFVRLLYHVEKDGIEYLYNEVVLKNIALEKTTLTFYAVLRPMSVLGFEPLETLEFDPQTNQIAANENLALQVDIAPSAVYLIEANDATIPEVIQSDELRNDIKISSKGGLATAILRFDVTLSPAGTRAIVFGSPLEVLPDKESLTGWTPKSRHRDQSIGNWYDFTEKRGETFFPDEKINSVLSQAAVSLAIQSQPVLFPEETDDASLNWRDRMRVLFALIKSGGIDVASQITNQAAQIFGDSDVSLDTTVFSPLLWGLLQLQGYSIQRESIQENIEYLVQLAENLVAALAVDRPRTKIVEQVGNELEDEPLEHYRVLNASMLKEFNESLWDLAALNESLSYFALTAVSLVAKIKDTIPIVENRAQEKFDEIQNARWPRPQDPQMNEIDRAILDILTSTVQLKINGFDKKFLRSLCKKVSGRRLVRDLWKTQEPTDLFSSHLALRIAHFHVWDKQRNAADPLLYRALEFMSEDFLLPEFVNPRTFGGSGGTGSSVLAAADIILLLSDMLVQEDKNNLVFLAGIPSEWYTSKKPLTIKGLHTRFGKTRIDIGLTANQHQIETGMEILPDEIEIHVPESVPIRMVKAYGGSIVDRAVKDRSPHLKLVPLSNDVVLTYHR
ncbi:MAG: hypothetical protein ACW99H_03410 [Candidatus Thorarchaeota archaeon]|jgi:hypothetical protein